METVYHYTSLNGLLGIVKNRSLWATHTSYLNDSTEFFHALSFAKQIAGGIFMNDDYLATFGWAVRHALESLSPINLYVTSFSEKPDLLSQWRGYCPSGAGLCLGFDFDQLEEFCIRQGYRIEKCIYGHDEQVRQVNFLVQQCLNDFPRLPVERAQYDALLSEQRVEFAMNSHALVTSGEGKLEANAAVAWLCNEIVKLAPLWKNEGFYEESEWRIVASRLEEPLQFRASSSYLAPYIDLKLLTSGTSSALREVIVGPNPNQVRCANSVRMLLEENELGVVPVTYSPLPFNNW